MRQTAWDTLHACLVMTDWLCYIRVWERCNGSTSTSTSCLYCSQLLVADWRTVKFNELSWCRRWTVRLYHVCMSVSLSCAVVQQTDRRWWSPLCGRLSVKARHRSCALVASAVIVPHNNWFISVIYFLYLSTLALAIQPATQSQYPLIWPDLTWPGS